MSGDAHAAAAAASPAPPVPAPHPTVGRLIVAPERDSTAGESPSHTSSASWTTSAPFHAVDVRRTRRAPESAYVYATMRELRHCATYTALDEKAPPEGAPPPVPLDEGDDGASDRSRPTPSGRTLRSGSAPKLAPFTTTVNRRPSDPSHAQPGVVDVVNGHGKAMLLLVVVVEAFADAHTVSADASETMDGGSYENTLADVTIDDVRGGGAPPPVGVAAAITRTPSPAPANQGGNAKVTFTVPSGLVAAARPAGVAGASTAASVSALAPLPSKICSGCAASKRGKSVPVTVISVGVAGSERTGPWLGDTASTTGGLKLNTASATGGPLDCPPTVTRK